MTFADQLYKIIIKENLSYKDVCLRCGIHKSNLSRYLSGKVTPSYETACRIIKDLGYELVGIEKDPNDKELRKNGSGYTDPTAYKAIKKADKDREKMLKLLDMIFAIADLAGFHVEERIVLRDKKTGKIWK